MTMAKSEKTPVVINDVEYFYEDMTQQQQAIVNHIADLDRKIGSTQFNLDQMQVGRNAFSEMLKLAVEQSEEAEVIEVE
jgi:seryl-tRNA synthetase